MIEFPYVTLTTSGIQLTVSNLRVNEILRKVLLTDIEHADFYLAAVLVVLLCVCFKLLHAFSRPPPVQRKLLRRRPALQILFKPDPDIVSSSQQQHDSTGNHEFDSNCEDMSVDPSIPNVVVSEHLHGDNFSGTGASRTGSYTSEKSKPKKPTIRPHDLPDSFAPLLSSSQMEILYEELSTDLLHALQLEGCIRLRGGRHDVPLDKDSSRPQLVLDIPNEGCKVTAVAAVGSDGFSTEHDLNPAIETKERSLPMVKHFGVTLDPPLPLKNVAPTLIHFPTLFEDNVVKYTLRRIQIVRYALDMLKSISSFIEKILWILESKCQIHLGKVSVTPIYKGAEKVGDDGICCEPQWRLSLAFSGHAILFGFIPIPFVNITLPTWIIPQPHALLDYLASSQPLASAKMKREEIAEERITLAVINTVETWDLKVKALVTPPALSVDLTMPGGITVAVEAMHGTDVSGGRPRGGVESSGYGIVESNSNSDTLSSCTIFSENDNTRARFRRHRAKSAMNQSSSISKVFDANNLVPWKFNVIMKGKVEKNQISVACTKFSAVHDPYIRQDKPFKTGEKVGSRISLSGNFVVRNPDAAAYEKADQDANFPRKVSTNQLHNLALEANRRTVAATLLFPEKNSSNNRRHQNLLKYDYNLDIDEDTSLDAVSLSVGATHPMLKGGTIITTILESIYAHGILSARENSIVDMIELTRKRNILRHLPAVDFTAGIQNVYIPEESMSFSDDGQTRCLPELLGGQMMLRVMGGFKTMSSSMQNDGSSNKKRFDLPDRTPSSDLHVDEGIRVVLDFGVGSLALNNQTNVHEFPELDVFEEKLLSTLAGSIDGTIGFHLRPQKLGQNTMVALSKNIFNPLEAYEIDFSGKKKGSCPRLKMCVCYCYW